MHFVRDKISYENEKARENTQIYDQISCSKSPPHFCLRIDDQLFGEIQKQ